MTFHPRHFPSNALLVDTALMLALILVGAIGYKLSPLLMPQADLTIAPLAGCDLNRGACSADLPGGGALKFEITPQPIPLASPFSMRLELTGMQVQRAAIDFAGVSMNMGFNRPALEATGPGRFAGQATLPVCVTGRMTWQATVLLEQGSQRIAIPFRFDAGH